MDYIDIKKLYKSGLLLEHDSKENILNKKFDVDMFYNNDYYKHKTYNDYTMNDSFLKPISDDKNFTSLKLHEYQDSDFESDEEDLFNDKYIDKYLKTKEDRTFQKKLEDLRILNKNNSHAKSKKKSKKSKDKHIYDKKENFSTDDDLSESEKLYCDNIIKHLKTCKKCKDYILHNFSETNDDLMNIAIYSITGVFLILLLDLFFKKGMSMS